MYTICNSFNVDAPSTNAFKDRLDKYWTAKLAVIVSTALLTFGLDDLAFNSTPSSVLFLQYFDTVGWVF